MSQFFGPLGITVIRKFIDPGEQSLGHRATDAVALGVRVLIAEEAIRRFDVVLGRALPARTNRFE